jgi:hypothetical protein
MCDQTLNVFQPAKGGLIKAYAATTKKRLAVASRFAEIRREQVRRAARD